MILSSNMAWPPRRAEVTAAFQEWDAWYTGSTARLDSVYAKTRVRPSQLAGGLVGGVSRMLWGKPPGPAYQDNRIHLPLASDIASAASDLLFGEELQLSFDEGISEPVATRFNAILDGNNWQSLLAEAGELAAALGGVYLRAGWDADVADHVLISVVHADGALPTFAYGHLTEVTFWDVVREDGARVIRHTETHRRGEIVHQVWDGTTSSLGTLGNLLDYPSLAGIAASLDTEDAILTGIGKLTAAYIPNVRPAALWRAVPEARSLGRSDFGAVGVTGLFDALDETWTSWMRDIRHGKSRIFASSTVLQTTGPGDGAFFDADQEIFEALRVPVGEDPSIDKLISAQQFAIRVEEHSKTIRELTLAAVNGCGYSGSTFGLDTDVAKTATEVGAVRARTVSTRSKKIRYWTPVLERFLAALGDLDASIFRSGTAGLSPRVSFPGPAPTMIELAQTAQALKAAGAASTQTLVQLIHPDWDTPQIEEEVARITSDNAPAPFVLGDPFGPDPRPVAKDADPEDEDSEE